MSFNGTNQYVTFGTAPGLGASSFTLEVWFKWTGGGTSATTGTGGIPDMIPLVTKGRGEAEGSNVDENYVFGIRAATGTLAADFEEGAGQPSPGLNHPVTGATVITTGVWHHAAATYDGASWSLYLDGSLDTTLAVGVLPRADSIQHAGLAAMINSTGGAGGFFGGILDEARIWNVARTLSEIQATKDVELLSAPGLLGRWGMNEGAGTLVTDSGPTGIHGTATGSPTWGTDTPTLSTPAAGPFALHFDGVNDHVTFGTALGLGASTFTLETWFRRDGAGVATSTGNGGVTSAIPLLTKGRGEAESSNVDMNYFLGIDSVTNRLVADFEEGAGGASPGLNHPITGTTALPANGVWHHAAVTYDGTWRLYLDGNLEATLAVGQPPRSDSIQHAGLATAMTSTGAVGGFFQGSLDEARIWNVARAQSDIQSTKNLEVLSAPGLIGRWGMNEGSGTLVGASTGSVNGTATNGPAWVAGVVASDSIPPAAPQNLTAAPGNALVSLAWTANNESDLAGYNVYRATSSPVPTNGTPLNGGSPVTSPSYNDYGLANGTQYFYAVVAVDSIGNASAPSSEASATPEVSAGAALDFDGVNDYVTFGPAPGLGSTAFTLETWFLRQGAGVSADTGTGGIVAIPLLTKGRHQSDGSNLDMNWFLGIQTSSNRLAADFEDTATGLNHPVVGVTAITNNVWHHAAATYDGSTWRLYLDGLFEGSVVANAVPRADSIQHAALATAMDSTGLAEGFFNGVLDETRVWNYARTQQEILATRDQEVDTAPGLIGRWGMNEGAGTLVADSSGNGVDGTATNGPVWVAGRIFGGGGGSAPAAPQSLSATPQGIDVGLSWTANGEPDLAGYNVYRSTSSPVSTGSTPLNGGTLLTSPAYTDANVGAGPTYYYVVTAVDLDSLESPPSNEASASIVDDPPAPPQNLGAAPGDHTVSLTWTANGEPDLAGYDVYRSTSSPVPLTTPINGVLLTSAAYFDSGLTNGVAYYYVVVAVDAGAHVSTASNEASATPLAAPGMALDFDGVNDYVTFGPAPALGSTTFTLETWFLRQGAGVSADTGTSGVIAIPLLTKGRHQSDGSNVDMNWFLGIQASSGVLTADFEDTATGLNHPVVGVTSVTSNVWHHAAATYDGTTWRLYLDGFLEATLAANATPRSDSIQHAALATAMDSTGLAEGFFNGVLDEARVWNYARTQVEILTTRNQEVGAAPGLIGRWGMNEGANTLVGDSSGSGVNGTATNGPVWVNSRTFGPGIGAPAAPQNLAATPQGGAIALAWTANSEPDLVGYNLYRATSSPVPTNGTPLNGPALLVSPAYTDLSVVGGQTYYYAVKAIDLDGLASPSSNEASASTQSVGTALDLGGAAYVTFGNPAKLHLPQFTVEAWFARQGAGTGADTGSGGIPAAIPLVARGRAETDTANVDMNYFLGIDSATNTLAADFEEGTGGASPSLNHPVFGSTTIPADGSWHHAAATYDGATWRLYLDGQLDGQANVGQPPASQGNQHASIGSALNSTGAASGFFDGVIDEVRIWNRALPVGELDANLNLELTSGNGLVARWGLNDATGNTAADSVAPLVNGSISGAFTWVAGAPLNITIDQPPNAPTLNAPADNASGVALPPTLDVDVSDPDGDNLTVTYYGRPAGSTLAPDFTIIALPDTQYYSSSLNGGSPAIFNSQTQWIVDQLASKNIAFVTQLGDCVEHGDNGGNPVEWQVADAAISKIEDPVATLLPEGIPYGIAAGNHDESPNGVPPSDGGTTTFYNQYFGASRFTGRSYYGGHYGTDNNNHYELFSASGMDFIIVHFEYDTSPAPALLAWADTLLQTYSNRRAIVVSHWIVNAGFNASFSAQGQAIYNALSHNPNLFLMLAGHVTAGEGQRTDSVGGRSLWSLLSDYQSRTNGGNGWLRILDFSPNNDVIHVKTYSPWLNQFETDSDSQFDIPYDMTGGAPFAVIGANTVPSGTSSTMVWNGLGSGTDYEWYVTVSDGQKTVTGPVWRFRTAGVGNLPPNVSAGPDQAITLPASANLDGTATDDGLPGPFTTTWSKFSGPGTVTFGNANLVDTTASFSTSGVYTLRLTANDGALSAFDDMVVTVSATNQAPTVNAGPNQTITLPASANLDGTVTDDGLPAPFTTTWSKFSGPGTVTFGNANAIDTTASFSQQGVYTLRLTANDGALSAFDDVVVTVNSSGGGGAITFEARVSVGTDDAEEKSGTVDNYSGKLDLGLDGGVSQTVGVRFNAVAIPQGAAIVNAWLQFMVDSADSSASSLDIHGEAADNPPTFKGSNNISSRAKTAAAVNWVPPGWTVVGQAGAAQQTPNLASVIQEIVSRPGWVSGNSLALIITGTGHRAAETFNGNHPEGAPLLHVEYGGGGPVNQPPSVNAGTDQTILLPASANLDGTVTDDGLPGPFTTTWSKISGPGTVTFGNASAVDTTVSFSTSGAYTLRLTADDGALIAFDEVVVTANQAPSVNAGLDQTITLPASANLDGTVSDDGIPGALATTWSKVSGPGTVTFGNASAVDTTASFSSAGAYTLRLTANDGAASVFDEVAITVNPGANQPPSVNAGLDQTITLPASANLDATVSDDGLPGGLTTTWSKVSGPGTVTFGDASAVDTTASFSSAGSYTLRLTANDGAASVFDEVVITVNPGPNQPPSVNAGLDQTITLPASANLDGTVTDDGLPAPLTTTWSKFSGPGTVTFGNANAVDTTASFSASGVYTLRLTANDGAVSAFDDVVVTVNSSGGTLVTLEVRVSVGPDDAEEKSGAVDNYSGKLDLGLDNGVSQTVGVRFNALAIPQGAAIVNAWLQFMVDSADSSASSLDIHGEAADNPPTFKGSNNISSRAKTAAAVNWVPPGWTVVGQAGAAQQTPNLASVIQEIVSRPGWVSGNSLALIITGTGHRAAETFNGNHPEGAPLLHVEYQ